MENISGNIYIRPNGPLDEGQPFPTHAHNFDHTTICFYGAIRIVDGDGVVTVLEAPRPDYEGPSHLLIKAGVTHEITALKQGSIFWCVYSHRNAQGEVVAEYGGNYDAYNTILENAT